MRQHKVVVGEGQPQMFLHPGQVFGETEDLTRQTAITLTAGQVVPFDVAGIDGLAGRRGLETGLDRRFIAASSPKRIRVVTSTTRPLRRCLTIWA